MDLVHGCLLGAAAICSKLSVAAEAVGPDKSAGLREVAAAAVRMARELPISMSRARYTSLWATAAPLVEQLVRLGLIAR